MALALIFLVVFAAVLMGAAYVIWKSKTSDNNKIIAIIALLGIFCLVSILNEARRSGSGRITVRDSPASFDFDHLFFGFRKADPPTQYKLPHLDTREFLARNLQGINLEGSDGHQVMLLVEGDTKIGKTYAFQRLAKDLQTKKQPVLYLDLKSQGAEADFLLRHPNIKVLEEEIRHFNANNQLPLIIIDNFDRAFHQENRLAASYCAICEPLRDLYDRRKVSVVLITNQADLKERLNLIPGYFKRVVNRRFEPYSLKDFKHYVIRDIAPLLGSRAGAFNDDAMELFYKKLGFSFEQLSLFVNSPYLIVEEFIEHQLGIVAKTLRAHEELNDLLQALTAMMYDKAERVYYYNNWISYGRLKTSGVTDLNEKIEQGIRLSILDYHNGHYRFRNPALFHGALVATTRHQSRYKVSIDEHDEF